MRVAAVNWKIRLLSSEAGFYRHLEELLDAAASQGARVVVLPELPTLELLSLAPDLDPRASARYVADRYDDYARALAELGGRLGLDIVGGSTLCHDAGRIVNRCPVILRGALAGYQDKLVMTQYELHEWGVSAGAGLARYPRSDLGVTICYDSEFPASGRALAESGALLQAVPAYTETIHGFQRVRWSCLARAVENQVFVIHASLVGTLGREPVRMAVGGSAIIAPSAPPFPENPVLAETQLNDEALAVADLNFDDLRACREQGDVRNWNDRNAGDFTVRN